MKALIFTLSCCCALTACSGGNYDDNPNAPINKPSNPDDPNKPTDPNNPSDPNSGKRQQQTIELVNIDSIPETFGAGDTIYLDNIFQASSGLPLTYEVREPLEKGICKLTGDDNNILQTLKQGYCYINAKQAGNNKYLPAALYKELTVPIKCPEGQRPRNKDVFGNNLDYYCVPNALHIYPIKDTPSGIVGQIFKLTIEGEKLSSQGENIKVSLPGCDDITFTPNNDHDRNRFLSCTPSQAGETRLIISSDGKELLNTPVVFMESNPIPPIPITKTGITWCANSNENNIDCADKEKLGEYFGLVQDGVVQSGIAHDYQTVNQNGDSCAIDKATGRVWELKTDDGGLRDKDWLYSWYDTNGSVNNGVIGDRGVPEDSAKCGNTLPDGLCNSQAYINALNKANYCGYSDWRLPRFNELYSLLDFSRLNNPPMIDSIFSNTTTHEQQFAKEGYYLTQKRYGINFNVALTGFDGKLIRAVRHSESLTAPSKSRYLVMSNGTEIKDTYTGLIWQRCAIGQTWDGSTCIGSPDDLSWLEAMQTSKSLGKGYRLPTIKELISIAEPKSPHLNDGGINAEIFPNNVPKSGFTTYLSSTPKHINTEQKTDIKKGSVASYQYKRVSSNIISRDKYQSRLPTATRPVREATD